MGINFLLNLYFFQKLREFYLLITIISNLKNINFRQTTYICKNLKMKILILNGPNLNLLGTREPEIYGSVSMENYLNDLQNSYPNHEILYFQSNVEGEIINRLQENDFEALIINPGAFTHYSYAIADCLKNISQPKIEVHISNIYKREEFRQKSVTAANTDGILSGFGMKGYLLAILSLV